MTAVSVVIPTYNRADLIGGTLDAILAQTLSPAEVIVVDDGSTDDTQAVLVRYAPKVRSVVVPNGGDLVARNVGTRAATSGLVAYCDSDDLWRPDFLARMTAFWDCEPALVSAFADFRLFRDDDWAPHSKFEEAPDSFWDGLDRSGDDAGIFRRPVVDRLIGFQPFFPSAMMVSRERFLALGGWDESVSRIIGCDAATALRVAEQPMGVLLAPLVGIRRHAGNISGDVQRMNLGDARILEMLLKARPSLAPHRTLIEDSIADRRAAAADTAFDRRDFAAVREVYPQLPPAYRSARRRLKRAISTLPAPVALLLAGALARG